MLPLDKVKARQLFSEVGKLTFPPLRCEDGLVYEVSDFYNTAEKLFKGAFSVEEVRRGEDIRLLESLIEDISSPIQITPTANLVRSLQMTPAHRDRLVAAFAAKIAKVSGDDRSFSSSMYSVDDAVGRLMYTCDEQHIPTGELMKALRSYYVRHSGAIRCSDTLRNTGDSGSLPRVVNEFNAKLRALGDKRIPEIEADEVKPSGIDGKVDVHYYWESPQAQRLMRDFKKLRFGSGLKPLTAVEMDGLQWKGSLREFLTELSNWRRDDEKGTAEDYFHQKCNLLEALLNTLRAGPDRDEANRQLVALLSSLDAEHVSRIEWFWHAKNLLPASFGKAEGAMSAKLRDLLESSNNTVLYAYAQVWKTLSIEAPKANATLPHDRKP